MLTRQQGVSLLEELLAMELLVSLFESVGVVFVGGVRVLAAPWNS